MSRVDADIAVVGAGPAGQALALALAEAGYHVVLVDAGAGPAPACERSDLRVFALSLASTRLLASLGAWPGSQTERICAYRHMRVWQDDPSAALRFDAAEMGWPALGHIVEHGVLQHALAQRLCGHAGLQCHWGVRVHSLAHDADTVTLGLDDGASLRVRLAVAADGATSSLRALAGLAAPRTAYGQHGLVANIISQRPHAHTAWQRFLPGGPLALLPLAGLQHDARFTAMNACSIVWTLPDAQAHRLQQMPVAGFEQALNEAADGALGELSLDGARALFALGRQLAPQYHHGRVVLVADAAHVVHPLAGQGLNLGFLDVAALAEVLASARVRRLDPGLPALLARYARWRQGDNALAGRAFEAIGGLYRLDLPGATVVREAGHRLIAAAPPLRRRLAEHAAGLSGRIPQRCRVAA